MFSRVLGFARDAIVARIFGAGMATDAFFVAFKLPNLLRRIFAEGAFSQAFVPILATIASRAKPSTRENMVIELTAASDFNKFIGVLIQTHGQNACKAGAERGE